MYLKSIELQGFKSFADKIVLHFNRGITAVVGPNGSGKSNISDAVRWVLGEQSVKSLRGSKMEDVIFAGTQHRKPVGFAQVSLLIDNSDKTLPIEFSEVTITRRVYRSGESEYFINKTPCRLKDINELFMNTGVGKDGYSIIGQGRIDEILSTRPEDRRAIFEEAAGIMKYKMRKNEAERKLESTRQNLLRIDDIIHELESQLGPLQEQAEKARKYLSLSNELKSLEVALYLDNIEKSREKIEEIDEQFKKVEQEIREEKSILEEKIEENRGKTEKLDKLKKTLETLRAELIEADKCISELESRIKLDEEKINHMESNNAASDQDIDELRNRLKTLETDIEKRNARLMALDKDREKYTGLLYEAEEKLAAILSQLDESEKRIEFMKQEVMDKLDILSECRTKYNSLKNEKESFHTRQKKLEAEINRTALELDSERIKLEQVQNDLLKYKHCLENKKEEINGKEKQLHELKNALDALRKEQNGCISELQAVKSRSRILKDMENSLEGYSHSVKAVLKACREKEGFGEGIYGALAQLITVRDNFETAIEVSLGPALQNIVTRDEYTAKNAIEYLKQNNLGRATFLPVTAIKPRPMDPDTVKKLQNEKGYLGLASEMVECAPNFRDIITNLLGRTVVVDNIDNGIELSRKYQYGFRVVTTEGEVLNPGGSMTGGSQPSKTSSLLSRNRIIKELDERIQVLSAKLQEIEEACRNKVSDINRVENELRLLQKERQDLELTVLREEQRILSFKNSIEELKSKQDMLSAEKKELLKNIETIDGEILLERKRIDEIEQDIENLKATIEERQEKRKKEQAERDAVHADINNYKVSVNSILESMDQIRESIRNLNEEKKQIEANIEKRIQDQAKNRERIENLKSEIAGLREEIRARNEIKTGKLMKVESISEEVAALEEEVSGMVEVVSVHNSNIQILQEQYNKLEIRKTRLEAELEALQNRLWDEYELTYGTAQEYKMEITNIRQLQSRINELKAEIREMGPVNVSAIEDYGKTKERYNFMVKQKEDLVKSEEKLNRIIREMLSVMKKQFMEEFERINKNFNDVFRELFDGGRAEVVLEDPDNVLECGIEIIAQPPGKKLQNMMLLSGGERAMTAIALLFAILKLRPAPFCILDEIEASLDDANVYKFADYIKKLAGTTQFIVITHRKGTMEASDALYGITMQEHGVSSVVSLKLSDVDKAV
ncbi:chromosome segregation protein SMC [Thermoclostridium stercorarium]|uniref:chromosome segregation protein SMC n=1 Tax=Thermoclostridium stercorarium TaxID=1510 RepID=UPI0004B1595F|nr:chromosome segregation protein SMC [Thermoclostridium stercorarium]